MKGCSTIVLFALITVVLVWGIKFDVRLTVFAQGNSQPVMYLPINITNTQDVATPNPFQAMISINSSDYSAYEAQDLSNVNFAYLNGTVIPSWLESGNSNASSDTVYWLKLSRIPAMSNLTVNMNFWPIGDNVLNNVITGEAPNLSPVYGEYDNGPSVFIVYTDFNNSLGAWNATLFSGGFTPVTSQNGVEMLDNRGSELTYLVLPPSLPSIPVQVEEAWDYNGGADANTLSIGPSPFDTANNVILSGSGAPVLNNSICASFDYYGGWTTLYDYTSSNLIASSSFSSGGNFHILSSVTMNGTWASAGYLTQEISLDEFGSTPVPTALSGQISTVFVNPVLLIGARDGGGTSYQHIRWLIVRALPPNGVMPSVTLGNITSASVPGSPTGLTVTSLSSVIGLSWTAPANNGGASITNYKIYRGTSKGSETFLTEIGNTITYNDTSVTNATSNYYCVSAVNNVGEGPKSTEAGPIAVPEFPSAWILLTMMSLTLVFACITSKLSKKRARALSKTHEPSISCRRWT